MHVHVEVVDDLLKLAILACSGIAAWYGRRTHRLSKGIDRAVNGVTDPATKTLRENVEDIHDATVKPE